MAAGWTTVRTEVGGSMVVRPEPSGLSAARRLVRGIAGRLMLSEDDTAGLVIAVGEALSNAYAHGASGRHDLIQLDWKSSDGLLMISVEDDGHGPTPIEADCFRPRGNGMRLMRELLDDVRIDFAEGTRVILRKNIRRQPEA